MLHLQFRSSPRWSMSETIEITRYPNRRLYDRSQKKYVTIGDIEAMVLSGRNICVRDSKSNADLTRMILVQILLERHPERMTMFPVTFLQEILRADRMALDWLTIYFGQAKTLMDGIAGSANASLLPAMDFWQSMISGGRKDGNSQSSVGAQMPDASADRGEQGSSHEMAAKLVELERRLKQLEGEQHDSAAS